MDLSHLSDLVDQVSQTYVAKYGIERTDEWFLLKLQEEMGELVQAYLMKNGQARKKGLSEKQIEENFQAEVVDVFCHVLLLAKHSGVKLENGVEKKWFSKI